MVRDAVAEELRSACQGQQTLSNETRRTQTFSLSPSIQILLPSERPCTPPAYLRLDDTSDRHSLEHFEEMEEDLLLPYQRRKDDYTTFPSNMQEQRPYIKMKTLTFSWYYRAFIGSFSVVVSERHKVTAEREEDVLHVEIQIFSWRWISSRGFQARILYDRTHGLSSPTNIQLSFPRIIPLPSVKDGIWRLFSERKSDAIIDNIRSGVYRPDDLFEVIGCPKGEIKQSGRDWEGPTSSLIVSSFANLLDLVGIWTAHCA